MPNNDFISSITQNLQLSRNSLKNKYGLNFNPFPKSGIAVIDEADDIVSRLSPVTDKTSRTIVEYIRDALGKNSRPGDRDNLSLLIRGDYGTGKTQTLMFLKYLLKNINIDGFKPYVVYIDNPGQKFSDIVGNIVSQVGMENFRRYLWEEFWRYLNETNKEGTTTRDTLTNEIKGILRGTRTQLDLFPNEINKKISGISSDTTSYKYMYDSLVEGLSSTLQKQISNVFKKYMINCFSSEYDVSVIAEYFYDIVSDSIGVNKSWNLMVRGNMGDIDKREVNILNAVVAIVQKYESCTHFIMLVDEFEEITVDRVKAIDKDNYFRNLRTFIDRDKHWSCVFAMTGKAFEMIETYSPPLSERIADRKIDLLPLNASTLKIMLGNYLSLARDSHSTELFPFDETAIDALLATKDSSLQGSPRFILKSCYQLLQRAVEEQDTVKIDAAFIKKYLSDSVKQ